MERGDRGVETSNGGFQFKDERPHSALGQYQRFHHSASGIRHLSLPDLPLAATKVTREVGDAAECLLFSKFALSLASKQPPMPKSISLCAPWRGAGSKCDGSLPSVGISPR